MREKVIDNHSANINRETAAADFMVNGKEIMFSFVIDYSADESGNFVLYEVQTTCSDLHTNALDPTETKNNASKMQTAWANFFFAFGKSHFFIDLMFQLNNDKAKQRALFLENPDCAAYNPKSIIFTDASASMFTENLTLEKVRSIRKFFNGGSIVIKSKAFLGHGNCFFSINDDTNDLEIFFYFEKHAW